jgi:hypothetical protein
LKALKPLPHSEHSNIRGHYLRQTTKALLALGPQFRDAHLSLDLARYAFWLGKTPRLLTAPLRVEAAPTALAIAYCAYAGLVVVWLAFLQQRFSMY